MALDHDSYRSTIVEAAEQLKLGNLVAFPTETVYGLGADATNKNAVSRMYKVKGRPENHPVIVHLASIDFITKWVREIPDYALKLISSFWPGPMTLVLPRSGLAQNFITGGQDNVAIRIPAHQVALELLKEFESQGGLGVVAPSANRFGKVSPTVAQDIERDLGDFLSSNDKILNGGPCQIGLESTIIDCTKSIPKILRPGGVSKEMIEEVLSTKLVQTKQLSDGIKVPGSHASHYAPSAKVYMNGIPNKGDGLIALSEIPTPQGVFRLASPKTVAEFAHIYYRALRMGDLKGIQNIYVVVPSGGGLSVALTDRIRKAARS